MKAENDDSAGSANLLVNSNALPSRKRTHSSSDEGNKSKIQKVAGDAESVTSLLSFSDDILLVLLSYLNAVDLMSVRQCCSRLADIASDWSLWNKVDLRSSSLLESELQKYLPLLRDTTEFLAIKGFMSYEPLPRAKTQCLSHKLLLEIKKSCPSLKSFILEEHYIDANDIKVNQFPSSLKHWSLKGSKIVNLPRNSSYFVGIHHMLPNLQVLDLTDCSWVPSHSILALSKLPRLQELRLKGCKRMKDCIAYASLAFSHGFSEVQVLDLRKTGFSDSELPCINRWNRLTHVYLEFGGNEAGNPNSPDSSSDEEWAFVADVVHTPTVSDSGIRSLISSTKGHPPFRTNLFIYFGNDELVGVPVKNLEGRCRLHTIVARHFTSITDASLEAVRAVPTLRYLDLTGTGISQEGVAQFRESRPDVTLVTSFDTDM